MGKVIHIQLPKSQGGSGAIKGNDLKPGDRISVDQYESTVLGCLWGSKGRTRDDNMFNGGTIFVDHASGLIHVEHQVSLNASDTICSKILFEHMAKTHGIAISNYHGDNDIFTAASF